MKLTSAIIIVILFASLGNAYSQSSNYKTHREVYFSSSSFLDGPYDFQYKAGIGDNLFWRIGLVNISASFNEYASSMPSLSTDFPERHFFLRAELHSGLEKRLKIAHKIYLFYGADLIFQSRFIREFDMDPYLSNEQDVLWSRSLGGGLGFSTGLKIYLMKGFSFGAYFSPSLIYKNTKVEYRNEDNNIEFNVYNFIEFNTNSNAVRFALIYQWDKKKD